MTPLIYIFQGAPKLHRTINWQSLKLYDNKMYAVLEYRVESSFTICVLTSFLNVEQINWGEALIYR